jgi:hypothetical protein
MRFIWYWEYNQREILKMFEVKRRVGEDRKNHPDKYPKVIFGAIGLEWSQRVSQSMRLTIPNR